MKTNLCIFALTLLCLATITGIATASQDDPEGDAKLQAMKPDIEACMRPGVAGEVATKAFSIKYNIPMDELNATFAKTRTNKDDPVSLSSTIVCNYECKVPKIRELWENRAKALTFSCGSNARYGQDFCILYTLKCNHLIFDKDCALARLGHCVMTR